MTENAPPLRDSPRAPVRLEALLELEDGSATRVNVVDLSESGARLEGPLGDASGDGELQLENGLAVQCEVVRPGPDSCGLKFGKLDEKQRSQLRQMLANLVRSFEEEAVLTPRGPVELSAEGLLSGEMYERFGLANDCTDDDLELRGKEVLAAVERAIASSEGERKRRLTAVRKSFAHLMPTWSGGEERAAYNKHAGLDDEGERPLRGVQGQLDDISASALLISLSEGSRDAELQLQVGDAAVALAALEKGACVGAFAGDETGASALRMLAACREGLFYVHYGSPRGGVRNMKVEAGDLRDIAAAAADAAPPKMQPLPRSIRRQTPRRDQLSAAKKRGTMPPTESPVAEPPPTAPPSAVPAAVDNRGSLIVGAALVLLVILGVVLILATR